MIRIEKVGPLALAKVLGALYALLGFIFGAMFSLFALSAIAFPQMQDAPFPGFGRMFGIASVFLFPIFYGSMGFIGGLVAAGLYNLVAKYTGGIELKMQKTVPESPTLQGPPSY